MADFGEEILAEQDAASQISAQETKEQDEFSWSEELRRKYDITGYRHAETILKHDFPDIYDQLTQMLESFRFPYSHAIVGGGGKGPIAVDFDDLLQVQGFKEKQVDVAQIIDGRRLESPTHKVDFYKERIAVELEWNNKTEFYDRDLDNFRKLHSLGVLSVGIIVTRATSMDSLFTRIDGLLTQMPFEYFRKNGKRNVVTVISSKYGASTTNADKIYPKIEGGAGGQCPLLVFAMKEPLAFDNYSDAMKRAGQAGRVHVTPDDLIATSDVDSHDFEDVED